MSMDPISVAALVDAQQYIEHCRRVLFPGTATAKRFRMLRANLDAFISALEAAQAGGPALVPAIQWQTNVVFQGVGYDGPPINGRQCAYVVVYAFRLAH